MAAETTKDPRTVALEATLDRELGAFLELQAHRRDALRVTLEEEAAAQAEAAKLARRANRADALGADTQRELDEQGAAIDRALDSGGRR